MFSKRASGLIHNQLPHIGTTKFGLEIHNFGRGRKILSVNKKSFDKVVEEKL